MNHACLPTAVGARHSVKLFSLQAALFAFVNRLEMVYYFRPLIQNELNRMMSADEIDAQCSTCTMTIITATATTKSYTTTKRYRGRLCMFLWSRPLIHSGRVSPCQNQNSDDNGTNQNESYHHHRDEHDETVPSWSACVRSNNGSYFVEILFVESTYVVRRREYLIYATHLPMNSHLELIGSSK